MIAISLICFLQENQLEKEVPDVEEFEGTVQNDMLHRYIDVIHFYQDIL